jgi:hypothetical protein
VAAAVGRQGQVIVYRAGAGHIGITGRLEAVRSCDAVGWSDPVVLADSQWDDRNPAVGVTVEGTIVVAYHLNGCYAGPRQYDPKLGRFKTCLTRSTDGGATWERPWALNLEAFNGLSPYGQMFALDDGRLMLPIYGSPGWKSAGDLPVASYLLCSRDGGVTWGEPALVKEGWNESAFLPLEDGRLLAVLRAEKDSHLGVCFGSRASPVQAWSGPADLTAACAHPPCLTGLSGGYAMLSYGYRAKPFGARALLSADGGRTWLRDSEIILADWAENWDCGYPSTVRLADGRLLTALYSTAGQGDAWSCKGARCHVLVWQEDQLLRALGL